MTKAAKGNIADAYFDLAICYEKGQGTGKNLKKAFQAYVTASNLGDKDAKHEVVRCIYYGIGTEKNIGLSKLLFDRHFKWNNLSSKKKSARSAHTVKT